MGVVALFVLLLGAGAIEATAAVDAGSTEHGSMGDVDGLERGQDAPLKLNTVNTGQQICPYCGMLNCTMQHYETDGAQGPTVMVMGGFPVAYFLAGFAAVILLSFLAVEWLSRPGTRAPWRFNLIAHKSVYRFVRHRWLQPMAQLSTIAVFVFLIYAGLTGSRVANITPVAVWTVWWGLLIFMVLFTGALWCHICPWDGIANILSRLRISGRGSSLSLRLNFPQWLSSMYPAIALFVLLTWLELGYGVTSNPRLTAYMGLGMAVMATGSALLWSEKKFCTHLCPVGRICGTYGGFAPLEIRGKKAETCARCRTEDCLNGNAHGYPCPVGLSLKTIERQGESACTFCTECIKSCNKQNVAINLRPFADGLLATRIPPLQEALMALFLLALTLFHGLSMTPAWENFKPGGSSLLKWMAVVGGTPRLLNFTVAMAVVCAVPMILYWLSVRLSAWLGGNTVPWRTLFRAYAYSLLPIALFYHLAHNAMHVLMEGGGIIPLLSDPLGRGSDIFGTASVHIGSLVNEQVLWLMQVGLIIIGHVYGIVVAHRMGHKLYTDPKQARRSLIPIPVMMVLISGVGLYLMHMDMNMRAGRM